MTPERFCALLDTYGSDFQRWPEVERESARALAAQASPELRQRLSDAALVDGWLDSHTVAVADEALIRRIVAAASAGVGVRDGATDAAPELPSRAPVAVPAPAPRASWWRVRRLWWGTGVVSIGVAGALAGAFVVSVALRITAPPAGADWPERTTAFSQLPADWSDE